MTQRESFEKFVKNTHHLEPTPEEIWQAAQAALIADIVERLEKLAYRGIGYEDQWWDMAINEAIEIVKKAGE